MQTQEESISYSLNDNPRDRKRRFSISELMEKMYKNTDEQQDEDRVKSLGDFIKFSNEGKLTKKEQLRRDRKAYESDGRIPPEETNSPADGTPVVVGNVNDTSQESEKSKGLSVAFVNGQIVLDTSSLNRRVDDYGSASEEEEAFEGKSRLKRRKSVVWSIEETREFYNCLRKYGTDFSMMNKVIKNRSRRDLKNKFMTEDKRNSHLVNMTLAVHLKELVKVPEVERTCLEKGNGVLPVIENTERDDDNERIDGLSDSSSSDSDECVRDLIE